MKGRIRLTEKQLANITRRIVREESRRGEKKGSEINTIMRALGNPKTVDEVITGYEKLYNQAEGKTDSIPTPEEVIRKAEEVRGDDDPVVSLLIWMVPMLIGVGIYLLWSWL